jgi:hypothetical protein
MDDQLGTLLGGVVRNLRKWPLDYVFAILREFAFDASTRVADYDNSRGV